MLLAYVRHQYHIHVSSALHVDSFDSSYAIAHKAHYTILKERWEKACFILMTLKKLKLKVYQ